MCSTQYVCKSCLCCRDTAEHVTSLPLPEDYTLEALGCVSHALLHSVAKVRWWHTDWRVCLDIVQSHELLTEHTSWNKPLSEVTGLKLCAVVHSECRDWQIGLVRLEQWWNGTSFAMNAIRFFSQPNLAFSLIVFTIYWFGMCLTYLMNHKWYNLSSLHRFSCALIWS